MGGAGSTSNSQFPGFSSQAPMTPEQQAFFESQQEAFLAFQQNFQNRQQNPPQFEMPQQQSQSSNSIPQTEPQPKKARGIYQDENKNSAFNHEKAWAILRSHPKWDAPEVAPVDFIEDENVDDEHVCQPVNTDELFRADPRPRPPELRLKREAAERAFQASKNKDDTITRLEELRFLALSTKDLSDDDAYWINIQKQQIKDKLRAQMPRGSGSNSQAEDSDE
ncbi:hypothetical protein Tco_0110327 [Tanacetum coccineum]